MLHKLSSFSSRFIKFCIYQDHYVFSHLFLCTKQTCRISVFHKCSCSYHSPDLVDQANLSWFV
ncbi:hypothetical protein AHF37_10799 [Paragonimus kellicotti]|nr:hypothetical protein AHF37_10799 [Paragonimus kellicotti]